MDEAQRKQKLKLMSKNIDIIYKYITDELMKKNNLNIALGDIPQLEIE